VSRSAGSATRVGPLTSVVIFALAVTGMGAIAMTVTMDGDNAAATPFGQAGVVVLAVVSTALVAVTLVALHRGTLRRHRRALSALLLLAMASAIVLAVFFFASGNTTSMLGYMPAQAAVGLGLASRAVLAAPAGQ
jgi:glucan phosphoethanolaminetransferase (alkaline phosphatase superfamily)